MSFLKVQCPECWRVFDLTRESDADEFQYGHDCEEPTSINKGPEDY